ncbi:MAG TPA: hypothetical protein VMW10_09385 [Alphaproteobacteria bacterium]|nr:hypothetical protein [Alphaproteobacteria bacterium]
MERKPEPFQCRMQIRNSRSTRSGELGWEIHEPGSAARDGDAECRCRIKICGILDDAEAFACPTVQETRLTELLLGPLLQDPCHFYLRTNIVCYLRGSLPRKKNVHRWKH